MRQVLDPDQKGCQGVLHLVGDPGGQPPRRLKFGGLDELRLRGSELLV